MKREIGDSVLLLSNGFTVFAGSMIDAQIHSHHAIQITIGLSEDFNMVIGNDTITDRCIILAKNIEHELNTQSDVILILIEPESAIGRQITSRMTERYQILQNIEFEFDVPVASRKWSSSSIDYFKNKVIKALCLTIPVKKYDERVDAILGYIKKMEYTGCVKTLADLVNLSESRLTHLFKEQEEVSLKFYLLWEKITIGVRYAMSDHDLTRAAYNAGFSDSAHMSRTFRRMFGLTLRSLFKNSRCVQVYFQSH